MGISGLSRSVTSSFAVRSGSRPAFYGQRTNDTALDDAWKDDAWNSDWQWRQQRQDHDRLGAKLEQEHRGYYADLITTTARDMEKKSSKDLLDVLATDYGFAWVDIAQMLGVSVPALRKWRTTGNATPTNHQRLSKLAAFVHSLATVGAIESPANWLLLPPLNEFTLTPKEIYTTESAPIILDYACGNISAEVMFDEVVKGWRQTRHSNYEVRKFDDGSSGIVRRA